MTTSLEFRKLSANGLVAAPYKPFMLSCSRRYSAKTQIHLAYVAYVDICKVIQHWHEAIPYTQVAQGNKKLYLD